MRKPARPTERQYQAFVQLFDYFNRELFEGRLRQPLLTFSKRRGSLGFFTPDAWRGRGEGRTIHQVSLCPAHVRETNARDLASTLVHEMCHHDQQDRGKAGKRGYHNKQFARWMKKLGLPTSKTGEPGGKETGVAMSHYIVPGGPLREGVRADGSPAGIAVRESGRDRSGGRGAPGRAGGEGAPEEA